MALAKALAQTIGYIILNRYNVNITMLGRWLLKRYLKRKFRDIGLFSDDAKIEKACEVLINYAKV